tara:strand:+ start:14615 stop:15487 length:873 start_codon:yes stop_codon:yes gene_type:complete
VLKNNKVIVTGGAGFVGSHLVEKLISRDCDVTVVDNYSSGSVENHIKGAKYISGSCIEINSLLKDESEADYLFHLGEYSRVEESFEDIDIVMKSNNNSFFEVIKLAKKLNAKLIYSASSTRFSKGNADEYMSPYSFTKLKNAELLKFYSKWFGLKYCITYFYNVFGGREISSGKYSTVIAKFLKLKKESSKKLPIVSPGTQKRNFTHVDDIVNGLLLIARKGNGDGYGIGSDVSHSIIEVAEMLNMDYELLPERPGNRNDSELILSKSKALGWEAKNSLKDYLKSMIHEE